MAKASKPWFRASKNTWYCTAEGKKVSLKVRGSANEAEAVKAWHRLFAGMPFASHQMPLESPIVPKAVPMVNGISVSEVLDGFLADCESRAKPNTLRVYRYFFQPFKAKHGSSKADALTCSTAEVYARLQAVWTDTSRNAFLGALATAFRWAERSCLIVRSPLYGLKRPPKASRGADAVVSPEQHERLYASAKPYFKPLLMFLYLTGCRPGEAKSVTAENFDEANAVVRLREHKTTHKGKSRSIFLCAEAVALLREQKALYGNGHLFRNRLGLAWTPNALVKAMIACRKKAGISGAFCYGYRHGFATDALASGVPDAQVAELLGHSGTAMLHKHYSHLGARAAV